MNRTKIVSWNVNGFRSVARKGWLDWLGQEQPDILCMQEIRATPDQLDEELIEPLYYKNFFVSYLPWILKEIVVSGIKTSGAILGFRKFKSNVKKIKASQRTPLGTVIYGNSITLTPGTLTVEVDQGCLFVHALCNSSLVELEIGEMDKKVSDLEK